MPFTFSHPAVVVPLAKRGLPLSALVVGSMAPDLPYFVIPSGKSNFSHTLPGVFLLDIPTGLIVLWVFHAFLKYPLLSLLPRSHRERLAPVAAQPRLNPRLFAVILCAVVIGILSHLVWDSATHYYGWEWFTHRGGWVSYLSELRWLSITFPNFHDLFFDTSLGKIFFFDILQYGSSVVGLGLLFYWYERWFNKTLPASLPLPFQFSEGTRRRSIGLIMALVGVVFGVALLNSRSGPAIASISEWVQGTARQVVVLSVKAGILGLLLYCLAWHRYAVVAKRRM
jgi:hypothetical protein